MSLQGTRYGLLGPGEWYILNDCCIMQAHFQILLAKANVH